ncbi:MAG: hypothetical protein J7M12_01890 [Candidatus Hydrogenedentes bacterium]|nr:hypothetical protein [Candidatus Hydrogenedentota bacterium]
MNSESKRILIVVDHKWRDLPGHSLLASCLQKKFGYDARLARVDVMAAHIYPFKPHMVVMPNLFGKSREEFAARMTAQNIHVAVLPPEGIAYSDESTQFLAHRWTDTSNIDLFLAWGPYVAETISKFDIMPEEKVKTVGCIRFDFHSEPFRTLRKPRDTFLKQHGLNAEWPTVTWATNYVYGSFHDKNTDFCLDTARSAGVDNVNVYHGLDTIKFDYKDRQRAMDAVSRFLDKTRHINFIIKPHPSEPVEVYEKFVNRVNHLDKRVKLLTGEYIEDVLGSTDVLVQRLSTACIDAWCAGVDTVELLTMDSYDDYVVNTTYTEGSVCASNGIELADAINHTLDGHDSAQHVREFREKTIAGFGYKPDGRSYMRIAEAIHGFRDTHPNERCIKWDKWQMRWGAEGAVKTMLRLPQNLKAREIIKKYVLHKAIEDYLGRFDKIVTDDAIRQWMKRWDAALDPDGEVRRCVQEHVA